MKSDLIDRVKEALKEMTEPERVEFIKEITHWFCTSCGRKMVGPCYCEIDE